LAYAYTDETECLISFTALDCNYTHSVMTISRISQAIVINYFRVDLDL